MLNYNDQSGNLLVQPVSAKCLVDGIFVSTNSFFSALGVFGDNCTNCHQTMTLYLLLSSWQLCKKVKQNCLTVMFDQPLYIKCRDMYIFDNEVRNYQKFVEQGYFTMRWSDHVWTGLWSDMTLEITLMRGLENKIFKTILIE